MDIIIRDGLSYFDLGGGGGAFSSKLIQLCLNTIYNSEFRIGGGGGSAETFWGGAKHLWGGGGATPLGGWQHL